MVLGDSATHAPLDQMHASCSNNKTRLPCQASAASRHRVDSLPSRLPSPAPPWPTCVECHDPEGRQCRYVAAPVDDVKVLELCGSRIGAHERALKLCRRFPWAGSSLLSLVVLRPRQLAALAEQCMEGCQQPHDTQQWRWQPLRTRQRCAKDGHQQDDHGGAEGGRKAELVCWRHCDGTGDGSLPGVNSRSRPHLIE